MGAVYHKQRRFKDANRAYNQALALDTSYYGYHLGRGLSNARLGNDVAARSDLNRSNELLPTAAAMTELGHLSLAAGQTTEAKQFYQTAMAAGGVLGQQARAGFVKLDLPDNPSRYISVDAQLRDGHLTARVVNRSDVAVATVNIRFSASVNGKTATRVITVGPLSGSLVANSGWRFAHTDNVESVSAIITHAQL